MWTALLATAGFVAILAGQVAQGQALLAFDRGDHARAEGQSEKGLTLAGATLGPVAAHAARLAGRQMNRAQATACALSPDDSLRVAPVGDASLLTVREREVAALVGRGLSNREIAQVLVITTGTAGLHVQHIFDKLGVHNRTLLAAWALAQELSSTPRTLRPAPDIPRVRNKLGNCSS
jgi:DNA-binding CsgD family transcriptional regulator